MSGGSCVNMMSWKITFLLFVATCAANPEVPGSNSIDGSSDSYGYGFSGSFSGGAPPNFPFPNFDFSNFFNGYLADLSKFHAEFMKNLQAQAQQAANAGGGGAGGFGGSFAGSGPGGGGFATSGGGPVNGGFGGGGSFFGSAPGGNGFTFSGGSPGAVATASIGPQGKQQTAAVYPENPTAPNVNTRFADTSQPGGFKSVSTYSSSHTTNVNGVPQTVQQATSTINDNGKITTYTSKNP